MSMYTVQDRSAESILGIIKGHSKHYACRLHTNTKYSDLHTTRSTQQDVTNNVCKLVTSLSTCVTFMSFDMYLFHLIETIMLQ